MEQDELDTLNAEYQKEREICSGANASEYHHKKFADLAKKLGVGLREKISEQADEKIKDTKQETTATVAEETTVVSTK
jgi:diphthamide synthase (EF-2-diphthine--ammonia ligase)